MVPAEEPQHRVAARERQRQHGVFTACVYVQHTAPLMDLLQFSEYFD